MHNNDLILKVQTDYPVFVCVVPFQYRRARHSSVFSFFWPRSLSVWRKCLFAGGRFSLAAGWAARGASQAGPDQGGNPGKGTPRKMPKGPLPRSATAARLMRPKGAFSQLGLKSSEAP